jgi:hypothetical protein
MRPFIFLLGQVTHYKETLFFVFVKKKKKKKILVLFFIGQVAWNN